MAETCPPLAPLGIAYAAAMRLRNWLYDHRVLRAVRVPGVVLSVGNLSVGGTGKTPLVVWLVERARAAGRRPGVLARGYGRAPGAALNDEGLLLEARFPELPQVQDADRVAGAQRLLAGDGVDYVILDDGFQHRRIARDRDLVCLDATFGAAGGRVLPWGRLREPLSGLRRASAVVLTRAGALAAAAVAALTARVRALAGRDLPVFASEHEPSDLVAAPSGVRVPLTELRGRPVVLLSAIARPEAFERTVTALGARVVTHVARRDHHLHTASELGAVAAAAQAAGAWLLTTEKDESKLVRLAFERPFERPFERHVLRVRLRFLAAEPDAELLMLR